MPKHTQQMTAYPLPSLTTHSIVLTHWSKSASRSCNSTSTLGCDGASGPLTPLRDPSISRSSSPSFTALGAWLDGEAEAVALSKPRWFASTTSACVTLILRTLDALTLPVESVRTCVQSKASCQKGIQPHVRVWSPNGNTPRVGCHSRVTQQLRLDQGGIGHVMHADCVKGYGIQRHSSSRLHCKMQRQGRDKAIL